MGLIFPMPGNERLAARVGALCPWQVGHMEIRRFPDDESYIRILSDVAGHDVAIVCTLARPDSRFLRLIFVARALREYGARSVTLVAPYLPYMRQDAVFRKGETVTARHFADMISREFDHLVTLDPHLHRIMDLGEIYTIPVTTLHVAPLFSEWIKDNIAQPLILGPDAESEQWVSSIAKGANAPFHVFTKERHGDHAVSIRAPDLSGLRGYQPVLVDDIISSGTTIVEAAKHLVEQGLAKPACLVAHPLFNRGVWALLMARTSALISTDSVPHPTNAISIAPLLAGALQALPRR